MRYEKTSSQHEIAVKTSSLDKDTLLEDIDDAELVTELNFCNHFLVDSELGTGRYSVFNLAMSSFNNSFLNEKSDHVFKPFKCAVKVNTPLGFIPKKLEDGTSRYFYAHKNNTFMVRC